MRDSACDQSIVEQMRDRVTHRGPDDAGSYVVGPLGLGHRRLSIIDLSGGHQPMSIGDGRWTIVYNGEIYNYRELRRELEAGGARFRSNSDTEVILHLHAQRGDAAAVALNGIFAYALWDRDAGRLLLVRDRAGIKPLYYGATARGVAFGSEIKSLFSSGLVAPTLAWQHVAEYLLFRDVAGEETLFEGVTSVPPGSMIEVLAGVAGAPRRYWLANQPAEPFPGSYAQAVDALDGVLRAAVGRQLVADVPLGTFCSGGIDSSLVTAIACKLAGDEINTFSVGFEESAYDESAYARLAARACGSRHHEVRVTQSRFAELLPKLIWHNDLPLNFANSVHIFAVSELARRHVTVALTGEGADELFGGYPRYSIPRLAQFASVLPWALRSRLAALMVDVRDHRVRKVGMMLGQPLAEALLFNSTSIRPQLVDGLLGRSLDPDALSIRRELADAAMSRHASPYGAVAELDFQTYLVSILNRQDKMSMATSLEARVPFLDNAVIDIARSLPQQFRQTLYTRKRVLKDVALRYLPPQIVTRRKSGFGVPLAEWFRGEGPIAALLRDVISDHMFDDLLVKERLESMLDEHRQGASDNSELLWGVLNLGLWRSAYGC